MTPSLSKRLQYLEEKSAFQEQTIDALSDVVIDQQHQINEMQDTILKLQSLVNSNQNPAQEEKDPPPPHY